MTIFNIARFPIATFRDIEFNYQESTTDGGRKTITHEYPNSDNRYVEDLGGLEKVFSITAWTDNNSSYSNRNGLIAALEEAGIGTLVHPTFGTNDVVCKSYTVSDDIKQIGISRFSIIFEKSSRNLLPSKLKSNKGFLSSLKSTILGQSEDSFNANWSSVSNNLPKFKSAKNTMQRASREILSLSRAVQGAADPFSKFTTSINQIVNNANSLVQAPSTAASNFKTAFQNLEVAYSSSQDLFDSLKGMFGFDERDREASGNSQQDKDIKNNQDQINNNINANVMALAYNAAGSIDYQTLDDLNDTNNTLEEGFAALPSNLDRDVYNSLIDMRIEANKIFSDLAIGLPNVNNYTILNPISLNNLVYGLYGSLDLKTTIRDLNQFQDSSEISGTIKILSNV